MFTNIRLGCKGLPRENNLAYLSVASLTCKKFYKIGLKFLEATDISTAVTDSTYTNLIKLCFFQPVCVTERESGRQRERERE